MIEKSVSDLKLLLFENIAPYTELLHAVTTRIGGVSPPPFHSLNLGTGTDDAEPNVLTNYSLLARALDFDLQTVVTSHQVHGSRIAVVEEVPRSAVRFPRAHALDGYDGLLTEQPGVVLMIRVADCVPIILYEPDRKTLALAHAGWRGTLASIAEKTAAEMLRRGCRADRIYAGIGPAIGPCCFSVQSDVAELFRSSFGKDCPALRQDAAGTRIDLPELNRLQLLRAGIPTDHIKCAGICTACSLHLFFSHRGEQGKTGRFVLCAGLRA